MLVLTRKAINIKKDDANNGNEAATNGSCCQNLSKEDQRLQREKGVPVQSSSGKKKTPAATTNCCIVQTKAKSMKKKSYSKDQRKKQKIGEFEIFFRLIPNFILMNSINN